jgi:hypothetical protein
MDNTVNNLNKKYKTLEEKYKNALNDIKAKDEFFRQHLIGRTNEINVQEYIESVLNRYRENFDNL